MTKQEFSKKAPLVINDSVKVTSLLEAQPSTDLSFFSQGEPQAYALYFHPFENYQKRAKIYRYIFFSLSIIFFILTSLTFFQKTNWFTTVYLQNHLLAKSTVCVFCLSLSIAAGMLGWHIKSEKEAVQHLFRRAHHKIKMIFARKRARFGIKHFLAVFEDYQECKELKQNYHEAVDKLYEVRDSSLSLLERITKDQQLSQEEKAKLFNQVILELKDRFNTVIQHFHSRISL